MEQYIIDTAAGLWLGRRLRSLRLDPRSLSYPHQVHFASLADYAARTRQTRAELTAGSGSEDGMTLIRERGGRTLYLILYDDLAPPRRRAFTLAHEAGHILLGHRDDSPVSEREAHRFAAELLAPRILLREMSSRLGRPVRGEEVCRVFTISAAAARGQLSAAARCREFSQTELALLHAYGPLLPDPQEPALD